MDLQAMAETVWQIAEGKGHHENLSTIPLREATLVRLALIHTEVSEAAQLVRRHGIRRMNAAENRIDGQAKAVRDELAEELADIIIRVGDLAVELEIDLNIATDKKLAKNRLRPQYFGTPQEDCAH